MYRRSSVALLSRLYFIDNGFGSAGSVEVKLDDFGTRMVDWNRLLVLLEVVALGHWCHTLYRLGIKALYIARRLGIVIPSSAKASLREYLKNSFW